MDGGIANPIVPALGPGDRWLNVTPDFQFTRPEVSAIANDAFVYGLRVKCEL